jgi:hypothetical protein
MGEDSERFELPIGVQEADIDELGHVNNVTYVRWVQDAAVAHWTAAAPAAERARLLWIVLRHEIDYRQAAHLGDWRGHARFGAQSTPPRESPRRSAPRSDRGFRSRLLHPDLAALRAFPLPPLVVNVSLQLLHRDFAFSAGHAPIRITLIGLPAAAASSESPRMG